MKTMLLTIAFGLTSFLIASADEMYCRQLEDAGLQGKRVTIHRVDGAEAGDITGAIAAFRPGTLVIDIGESPSIIEPSFNDQGKIIEPRRPGRIYVNCSHIFSVESLP